MGYINPRYLLTFYLLTDMSHATVTWSSPLDIAFDVTGAHISVCIQMIAKHDRQR